MSYISQSGIRQLLDFANVVRMVTLTGVFASVSGCNGVDDPQPQVMSSTPSETCKGNNDGWYCAINPKLNVDPNDEIYDDYLIHCIGSKNADYKTCDNGCVIKSPGVNDVCSTSSSVSTTCKGNEDGWYCAVNPKLNVDPNDKFANGDLVHCVGSQSTETKTCTNGCTIKSAGMNDVCSPPATVTTCKGNKDGWYCSTNPELVIGSGDEFFDGDRIHCVGSKLAGQETCPNNNCIIKPSGVDDVCGGTVCGDGNVQGSEQCDTSSNMNGHTCASEGFNGGNIACTGSCTLNTAGCCKDACTGNTQCVGTTQQTCQDGNNDGCKEWVNTGTCPVNPVCGNSVIEGTELCDALNLNGHTCASEGFNGGNIACTGSCTLNTAGCCKHACTGNTQCVGTNEQTCKDGNNDGCNEWVTTGTCPVNPVCGNSVIEGSEQCDASNLNGHTCASEGFNGGSVSCSGSCTVNTASCCKDACTGNTQCVGTTLQTCQDGNNDGCKEWVNTGTCGTPTCTTVIGSNPCFTAWTTASGTYQIFEICAEIVVGDHLRIHMRKNPQTSFGTRPYGLKVFGLSDPECSHTTTYQEPTGGVSVTGIGTTELILDFNVTWAAGQTDKRYCGYASTVSSDPGYSSTDPQQKIWWYSHSLLIKRVCN